MQTNAVVHANIAVHVHKPAIIETTKSLTGVGESVGLDVGERVGLDVGDFVGLDGHTPSARQARLHVALGAVSGLYAD